MLGFEVALGVMLCVTFAILGLVKKFVFKDGIAFAVLLRSLLCGFVRLICPGTAAESAVLDWVDCLRCSARPDASLAGDDRCEPSLLRFPSSAALPFGVLCTAAAWL